MYRSTQTTLLALAAMLACSGDVLSETPTSREIYLPFEELSHLIAAPGRRVLLERDEYEALIKSARPKTADSPPPRDAVLMSANYDLTIADARARIRGELTFETLAEGVHAFPLNLEYVGLLSARLDGNDAAIGRNMDGHYLLFITGRGSYRLVLEMTAELRSASAQQQLTFRLPQAPAQSLRATVPGNVEVKQGAEVMARRVDEQAGVTRFELLPPAGKTTLVMSLNNRQQRGQRTVIAHSVLIDEITTSFERLHATVSLAILHQPVDRFRFRLPVGFEVLSVQSPALERWSVAGAGAQRELDVVLRRPTTEQVVLQIAATRSQATLEDWTFPRLEPLDVAGQMAVLGLLLDTRLKPESLAPTGLIPLDTAALNAALPRDASAAGEPVGRTVAAYYAPAADYELRGRFSQPAPKLRVTSNLGLTVAEADLQLRAGLALLPEAERLFEFDVEMPALWTVRRVMDDNKRPLAFDALPAAEGKSRIRVRLTSAIPAGTARNVYIEAEQTPANWLGDWKRRDVAFPVLSVVGAAKDMGAIAIASRDDLNLRPETLRDLTPLDDAERREVGLENLASQYAFRYENPGYAASFVVQRNVPRATARTFSFFRIDAGVVFAHYEVDFNIERAKAHRLSLLLPATTPDTVSLVGLDGLRVKEYTSAAVEGKNLRRWTALLADGRQGRVRLAVDVQFPLPADAPKNYALPIVVADDVAYQSGVVAVEASGELDVQFVRHPLKVDVGQLAEAEFEVGHRLLGVFGFVETDPQVTINVSRRPAYALPPALVQHARYVTLLSNDGLSQTAATLQLRSKLPYVEVDLPSGSTLWSADFDGQPALPQRQGKRLLIGFPADAGESLRTLQVVYETPVRQVSVAGRIKLPALGVFATGAGGDGRDDVPVADVQWEAYLPAGYRLFRSQGTLSLVADAAGRNELAAWQLARAPGAIRRALIPSLFSAREHARFAPSGSNSFGRPEAESRRLQELHGELINESIRQSVQGPRSVLDPNTPVTVGMSGGMGQGMGGGMGLESERAKLPAALPPAPAAAPAPVPPVAALQLAGKAGGELEKAAKDQVGGGGRANKQAAVGMLTALRSLPIELQPSGDRIELQSFGVEPELDIFLVDSRRVRLLAWLLALVTLVYGIAITRRPWRTKSRFLATVGLLATLLPLASGWFALAQVLNGAFYAACLLVPFYIVAGWCKLLWSHPNASSTLAALVALASFTGFAETQLVAAPPIKVPDDATILLFDKSNGLERPQASRILVPYDRFTELWKQAHADPKLTAKRPPADVAMAGATFSATLAGEDFLIVEGVIEFQVFVAEPVQLPLALAGGVVSTAKIDGQPAPLELIEPAGKPVPFTGEPLLALRTKGLGNHRLELTMRFKLNRGGGWRLVQGQLPVAAASTLNLLVPEARAQVRLNDVPDRQLIETRVAGEKIATALPAGGQLRLQWRPRVDAGQTDVTMQAQSDALVDVQEDGVRVAWQIKLELGRQPRDSVALSVPAGYLVEKIVGDNVRGWSATDPQQPGRLEVQFLRPAVAKETITVQLSDRSRFGEQPRSIKVPQVAVDGAALQAGQLTIRRSTVLDVETLVAQGASRIDLASASPQLVAGVADTSPLGLAEYEHYRFSAVPFVVELKVQPLASRAVADIQTVWKVGQRQRTLETRIHWTIEGRPRLQLRAAIPQDLEIDQIIAPGAFEWAVTPREQLRVLTVYLSAGQSGEAAIIIRGSLGSPGSVPSLPLPKIEALDVDRQQGEIVVQADPALNVETAELANCEVVLLEQTRAWLSAPQQQLARLALAYRDPNYGGTLRLSLRAPRVQGTTLTNVRLSDRSIEETILIDLTVREAGIREVVFLLPAALADATISAPRLRQKTVEPLAGQAGNEQVRVRLELQDAVMNDFRVLVEHDSLYTRVAHTAPIPVLETGQTIGRFVALETSARDEVVVETSTGLDRVVQGQQRSTALAQLMTSSATQAFRVQQDAAEPKLVYRPRDRALVETVAARIGLAETDLACDAQGTYRGVQTYHVYNSTEAYLEVELPKGARIWTATVAGEPVKPVQATDSKSGRRVRIPLVKSAAGDLDYAVALTYGGELPRFGVLSRVRFPLLRTVNISVELSQVRLFLPAEDRWLGFDGTMRPVAEQADLEAGILSYLTKMTRRLTDSLRKDDPYAQTRAQVNLDQLSSASNLGAVDVTGNAQLRREYSANAEALREAQQQAAALQQPRASALGNRQQLNTFYHNQTNGSALNVVDRLGDNFGTEKPKSGGEPAPQKVREASMFQIGDSFGAEKPASDGERAAKKAGGYGQFDAKWFYQNKLSASEPLADRDDKSISAYRKMTGQGGRMAGSEFNGQPAPPPAKPAAPGLPGVSITASVGTEFIGEKDVSDAVSRYADLLKRKNEVAQGQNVPAAAAGGRQDALWSRPERTEQVKDRGLASLAVEIPRRGTVFRFTTLRGDVEITARAIPAALVENISRLAIVIGVVAVARWLFGLLARRQKA